MVWVDPHGWLYIDATEIDGKPMEGGKAQPWALEFGSPVRLLQAGIRKEGLPICRLVRLSPSKHTAPRTAPIPPTQARSYWQTGRPCLPVRRPSRPARIIRNRIAARRRDRRRLIVPMVSPGLRCGVRNLNPGPSRQMTVPGESLEGRERGRGQVRRRTCGTGPPVQPFVGGYDVQEILCGSCCACCGRAPDAGAGVGPSCVRRGIR